jgi:hypothetical protein
MNRTLRRGRTTGVVASGIGILRELSARRAVAGIIQAKPIERLRSAHLRQEK